MNEPLARELDVQAAVDVLCRRFAPVVQTEGTTIGAAAGRVLARSVVAQIDLPPFANSAMDGYAVRAADCSGVAPLRVAGVALAGHSYDESIAPGTAVRIMTGAPLPPGADAVIRQEDVSLEADRISFPVPVSVGLNVRARGEHVRANETVLAAGTALFAPELALAVAVGVPRIDVFRQLRVGIASTGDELADPPAPLSAVGSYDANRQLLGGACRATGFVVTDLGICHDQPDDFTRLLDHARSAPVDALIVSGGSAQGDADVVRKADSLHFLPLSIRPGRGIVFGDAGRGGAPVALFGLPGNAVSAFVMFHLVVLPVLRHLAGGRAMVPPHLPLPLAVDLACNSGRIDYRRGRLERNSAGDLIVRPLAKQGAGMLRTVAEADVLIAAGPRARYQAEELIPVVPLATLPR